MAQVHIGNIRIETSDYNAKECFARLQDVVETGGWVYITTGPAKDTVIWVDRSTPIHIRFGQPQFLGGVQPLVF